LENTHFWAKLATYYSSKINEDLTAFPRPPQTKSLSEALSAIIVAVDSGLLQPNRFKFGSIRGLV